MRPHRPNSRLRTSARPWKALLLTTVALAIAALGASSASAAASEIEGVWSFNGGEVAVRGVGNGTYEGVVVTATKFAQCVHPVGETMWTNITPQSDGSYWGLHQWFFETTCIANPKLGPTAWRVQEGPKGGHFLQVCFSEPGKSQPTIAANGEGANASYGCVSSALISPLPVTETKGSGGGGEQVTIKNAAVLPKATQCVKHGSLKINLREPKRDPLKQVIVKLNGKKVVDVHGTAKLEHPIVLRSLPQGTFTVQVLATTVLDQTLSGRQSYHSCTKLSTSTIGLQGKGKSHGKGKGHGKGKKAS